MYIFHIVLFKNQQRFSMKTPITGIAQQFTEEELRRILDSDEIRKGNHGFVGVTCVSCRRQSNVPVSYLWTFSWTCTCEFANITPPNHNPWLLPWQRPEIGPPRAMLNKILEEFGLHGRKY